jgi:hypothetical protein
MEFTRAFLKVQLQEEKHMIGHRQQRIQHPAGLAAENLLAALSSSSPPYERHKMLQAIHTLEAGGRVSIAGKRHRGRSPARWFLLSCGNRTASQPTGFESDHGFFGRARLPRRRNGVI